MIKRIRDRIRKTSPNSIISYEEWENIVNKHNTAKYILRETNPFRILLEESLSNAEELILSNRIKEVHDHNVVSDKLKKVFITTKREQENETIGQIKLLRDILNTLQSWVDAKKDIENAVNKGVVKIESGEEYERRKGF